ncbi:MAG: mannose-6-phosphate isomerase [Bacteroidales bacterium]|nr:mannose-6-phosphate isomerase [Bacteroidales bacterium]
MNELYPLKFKTIFKDKIWGGDKIKTILGKDFSPLPNCGETWEISAVPGNLSLVKNGFLEGNNIEELIEVYMGDLVGDKIFEQFGVEFPLLIKFIDAKEILSVQVHPDDEMARKIYGGCGKTEMWYILDAEKNAKIISGFSKEVNKEMFLEHLQNKKLKDILNIENAAAGDVFFIPAGRIHATGAGICLAEIQQTSDTTYRIYDWDRVDENGISRELHLESALDVMDYKHYDNYKTIYQSELNKSSNIVECPYFTTNIIHLTKEISPDYNLIDSFVIYICVEGKMKIEYGKNSVDMIKGETILIPAILKNITLKPETETKLLEVYVF